VFFYEGPIQINKTVFPFALMLALVFAEAEETTACAIMDHPKNYDGKTINSTGTAAEVKQPTSRRGNDYSTFRLEDEGCSLKVFVWGHPTIKTGECMQVEGIFETEHHQGGYTFYNELQADKVSLCGTSS
jgi:hypothetical protein